MKARLRRWLPNPDSIRNARWARWMGPWLHHPRLWHLSRKGISLGVAIGMFFGLLLPFGQIPLAGGTAILMRANVPVALASTFVSNPITVPAIYYLAYRLGVLLVGAEASGPLAPGFEGHGAWPDPLRIERHVADAREAGALAAAWGRIEAMGKPLLVGLAVLSVTGGLLTHALVNLLWRLNVRTAWRRRLKERARRIEESLHDRPPPAAAVSTAVLDAAKEAAGPSRHPS